MIAKAFGPGGISLLYLRLAEGYGRRPRPVLPAQSRVTPTKVTDMLDLTTGCAQARISVQNVSPLAVARCGERPPWSPI